MESDTLTVEGRILRLEPDGMDRLELGETIHIPTGGEPEKYYIPTSSHSIRSPSILVIQNSPSPSKRTKLNKYQEVPKIASNKSKIPVLQKSGAAPSNFLRTSIYGQPVSASSQRSSSSNYNTPSFAFPADKATYESMLGDASNPRNMGVLTPSRNLPVLPAIGAIDHVGMYNQPTNHENTNTNVGRYNQPKMHGNINTNTQQQPSNYLDMAGPAPAPKQFYHVTNTKPVFQMKAEYNNMLQKYASIAEQQQATPTPHHHHSHHNMSCKGCGRHVPAPLPASRPNAEQSYVQQWLVDPSHPYQLPPEEIKTSVPTVPLVFAPPTENAGNKKSPSKPADVPIRYTQAPTQQMVSKSSGKLLSPEDALKRTLKRKKIPPLTKRNSLRSIFSDASSNLQKIAEEMEEDHDSDGKMSRRSKDTDAGVRMSTLQTSKQSLTEPESTDSKYVSTKRKGILLKPGTNTYSLYALLCRLLVEAGNIVLTNVFNTVYPSISLSENLSKPQVQKTLRRIKSQGILSSTYWDLLYPKGKAKVLADSFGSSLLLILLKSICHLSPPYPNGWNDLPLQNDNGLSADLARISWYMKSIASLESLSDEEFSNTWTHVATILTRLSGDACASLIKRIQREVLDMETQQFYIKSLHSSQIEQGTITEKETRTKPRDPSRNRRGTVMALKLNSSLANKSDTFVVSSPGKTKSTSPPKRKSVTWNSPNEGMKQEDKNAILTCYKMISDSVLPEDCIEHLVSRKVISKEDRNLILSHLIAGSAPSPRHAIMALLDILPNRAPNAYGEFLSVIEHTHPNIVQAIRSTRSSLLKQQKLQSTDIRVYVRDYLKKLYSDRFTRITPYFWDHSIVTDLKSHYVQLDITDLKGRRYPIERLYSETSRPSRVLLEGQTGSGKTMYCTKLVFDWSKGETLQMFDIVIYLDLNRVISSLEDAIYSQLGFYQGDVNMKKEEIMSILMASQRRVLMILDTYDSSRETHHEVLSLLNGGILEECSVLLTCLPVQVEELSPLCHKRLINLGLDSTREEQLIGRYALLNRGRADEYATAVSSNLRHKGDAYGYMMKLPYTLNLLCLLTQNEENLSQSVTTSFLLKTAFDIYPFLYCLKQGLPFDADNPPDDVIYAIHQLENLALETVLDSPTTAMTYEHVQQKYGCKLLLQMAVLDTHEYIKDNKPHQMLTFKSRYLQEFMAAMKLAQLSPEKFKKYIPRLITDPSLHTTSVFFVGCKRYSEDSSTSSQLLDFFNQLAKLNISKQKLRKGAHSLLVDFALSLECVNECENRKDLIRVVGQSLPNKLVVSPDQICSNYAVRGLNKIMEKNFSKVSHIVVVLNSASYFDMDTVLELAQSIRNSTSVAELHITYTSMELLTLFLTHITSDYRANILTLVCESRASPTEKLTASTYTDIKSTISSLSGITSFRLTSCKNSIALRNIVRHLPHTLHSLEISDSLLDSVSALDITAYLDGTSSLQILNLENCEISDGATGMSLFKGVRNNKSLIQLKLRGAALTTQTIKVLCETLKFNRVLQYLDIRNVDLSTQACVSLASVVNVNRSIKEMRLTSSSTSNEGLRILSETSREHFILSKD